MVSFNQYQESACTTPNAFFMRPHFIFFGECMLHYLLMKYGPEAVTGVIAHEFVHVLQRQEEWTGYRGPRDRELEADFLAGYFLAWYYKYNPGGWKRFSQCAYDAGDFKPFDRHHHGFPKQRQKAVKAGIQAALHAQQNAQSGKPTPSFDELHQQFLRFCQQFPAPGYRYPNVDKRD